MKFLSRGAVVSVLSCSALILAACAGGSNNSASNTDQSSMIDQSAQMKIADWNEVSRDQVKDGGTYTTSLGEISAQQNRFHADGTSYTSKIWNWYNPIMAYFTPEGEYSPNPDFVTDVKEETVDGNTKLTYTINDKATWNDGTPIDWTAFETTWIINNGKDSNYFPSATDGYERITSVTQGATAKEAVILFDGAYPWWQGLFNSIAHPALKDPANYNDYNKKVHPEWGAGPFTVESVDFNKGEAVFVPNDKWWGNKPKLDKRIFRQMENQAAVNAFKNGEIDSVTVSSKERYAAVKDMQNISIYTGRTPFTSLMLLNAQSPILSDSAVRQAIMEGTDRTTMSQIWFQGLPYAENPPGSFILYPFQEGYRDNFSLAAPYDSEKAAQILEDAGWSTGADGIREKNGEKLSLRYTLVGESETSTATAKALQQMMKNLGIDLQIDQRPSSEFSKVMTSADFDIFPMGFSSTDPFGVAYLGQTYLSDSTLNRSHTGTAEMDEKIREVQELPTREEQISAANDLEVELLKLYGIMPMYNGPAITATKKGLANVGSTAFGISPIEDVGWTADAA